MGSAWADAFAEIGQVFPGQSFVFFGYSSLFPCFWAVPLCFGKAYAYNQGRFQFDAGATCSLSACNGAAHEGALTPLCRSEADLRASNDQHARPAVEPFPGGDAGAAVDCFAESCQIFK